MVFFITVVISIISLLATWYGLSSLTHRFTGRQDEIHYAPTKDGVSVALYRYRPEKLTRDREPVIMCHGFGGNRFTWDLGPIPSFGLYLKQQGFDVWLLDLRGHGLSSRPDRDRGGRLKWGWSFDDYVQYDLPAAIKHVLAETGSKKVNWVGHSMGGMVMYAYLQNHDPSLVKSALAIGSPARFSEYKLLRWISRRAEHRIKNMNAFPTKFFARMATLFGYLVPTSPFGSQRNLYPWLAMNAAESPSTGVVAQFAHWVGHGVFGPKGDSKRYDEGLENVTTPFLVVQGSGDFIAPPKSVKYAAERMPNGRFAYFSKKHGALENYDHMTILMGQSAVKEVWPVMLEWLEEHSGTDKR